MNMSKLNDLIKDLCPDGVEYKYIWEVTVWDKKFKGVGEEKQLKICNYPYFLSKNIEEVTIDKGDVKILTTNTSNLFTKEHLVKKYLCDSEIVAIPGGGNPNVQYYKGKFITTDNRIATSIDNRVLSNKFLYYFFKNNIEKLASFYRGAGIKHPDMVKVLELKIPLPPIEVQQEIVRILDIFKNGINDILIDGVKLRQKQYEYYRDCLLNFKYKSSEFNKKKVCNMSKLNDLIKKLCPDGVEYKNVGDVCEVFGGKRLNKSLLTEHGKYPVYGGGVTYFGFTDKYNVEANTVIIVRFGNAGFVNFVPTKFWASDNCYYCKPNEDIILNKYLYYILKEKQEFLMSSRYGAGLPALKIETLRNIKIPIPTLEAQQYIIDILDKFDKLCNDIIDGLPAEIEARQKQYEYYRNKLLNFKIK